MGRSVPGRGADTVRSLWWALRFNVPKLLELGWQSLTDTGASS